MHYMTVVITDVRKPIDLETISLLIRLRFLDDTRPVGDKLTDIGATLMGGA